MRAKILKHIQGGQRTRECLIKCPCGTEMLQTSFDWAARGYTTCPNCRARIYYRGCLVDARATGLCGAEA